MQESHVSIGSSLEANAASERTGQVHRGLWLEYLTLGWNSMEAVIAIVSGVLAGSVALMGFGLDSVIEIAAGLVLVWRLWAERRHGEASEDAERRAVRFIGVTFFLLSAYIVAEALYTLVGRNEPHQSFAGIGLVAASLVVMPGLAWMKRRVARRLGSAALHAESNGTLLCSYLSLTVLVGLGANALFGWWWADPVAALGIVYFTLREGWESFTQQELCCD